MFEAIDANPEEYGLDESAQSVSAGLHFHDVARLVSQLHGLDDQAHTLLVIEHKMDVIKNADWIIDLGPGGGDR